MRRWRRSEGWSTRSRLSDILAFTGHRPNKLVGHESSVQISLVDYLTAQRPDEAITGMADGFDTYAALACLELDIPLTAAIPFRGHRSNVDQDVYDFIITHCKRVVHVSESYLGPWVMQTRNVWMVDNSTRLGTCWDGTKGGTANCVRYARKVGRRIDRIWGVDPNV